MNLTRHSLAAAVALSVLGSLGCGGKPPKPEPDPTVVRLDLVADASANIDARGRATPVVLRYYLLQSTSAFEGADYFSLYDRDEALLGAARIQREELILVPGHTRSVELRPSGEANFLGVFVAYREVNKTLWRATNAIPQNKTSKYVVLVGRNGVSISSVTP